MLSKVEDRLGDVEIENELQYSFIFVLNGTIKNNSDTWSMGSNATKHTIFQKRSEESTPIQDQKVLSKVRCYKCHDFGHYAFQCFQKKIKRINGEKKENRRSTLK